jgi:signal transduction histidine kinase
MTDNKTNSSLNELERGGLMIDNDVILQLKDALTLNTQEMNIIIDKFSDFFQKYSNKIITDWINKVQEKIPVYNDQPTIELQANALENINAFMEFLKGNYRATNDLVHRVSYLRNSQGFNANEVINAVLIGLTTIQRELYYACMQKCPVNTLFEMLELVRNWFEIVISYHVKKHSRLQTDILAVQKEELSHFAHVLAHDLRNYLYSIGGYISLIKPQNPITEKVKNILTHIDELLETSITLAEAGETINEKLLVDVKDVVDPVADIVIPKNILLRSYDLPKIYCDSIRLGQVFKNILENAVNHGKPSEIEVYSTGEEGRKILFISNNGASFPDKMLEFIEDSDISFSPKRKGMGLQIIKKIIVAHNWKITATNYPKPTIIIQTFLD